MNPLKSAIKALQAMPAAGDSATTLSGSRPGSRFTGVAGRLPHPDLVAFMAEDLPAEVTVTRGDDVVNAITFVDAGNEAHLEALIDDIDVLSDDLDDAEDDGDEPAIEQMRFQLELARTRGIVFAIRGDEDEIIVDGLTGEVVQRQGEGPEYRRVAPSIAAWIQDFVARGGSRTPEAVQEHVSSSSEDKQATVALFTPSQIPGAQTLLDDVDRPGWSEVVFAFYKPGERKRMEDVAGALPSEEEIGDEDKAAARALYGWLFDVLADPEQLLDLGVMTLDELKVAIEKSGMPEPPPSAFVDGSLQFACHYWLDMPLQAVISESVVAGFRVREVADGLLGR